MKLNPSQKIVVTDVNGPIMVLAGAGSGKTKTLVNRIIYLMDEKKISPFRILALTFSNKSAKEMKERVSSEVNFDIGTLQMTTFHSFSARLLRNEATYLGLSKNFTIYDDSESRMIIKTLLKRRGISPKEISPYEIQYYISNLKNNGHYLGNKDSSIDEDAEFYSFFLDYESELHKANAVDFGGLLTGVLKLFYNYPEVLENYKKRYQYILVDEYQDTNRVQFLIIKLLSEGHRNICVVGDEDQSIYSWRGADIRNILDFEKYFPETKIIKLEQNYRSSKNIIEAATAVISRNQVRKGKKMWTENPGGEVIEIIECSNEKIEAQYVSDTILKLRGNNVEYKEMAIFYRTNAQSRIIEDSLRKYNIPYRIVGGIKFYERKEIKDLLSYLRVIVNEKDSLAFSRIINVPPRGVGATTLRKMEDLAINESTSLWKTMTLIVENYELYNIRLSARMKSGLKQLSELIEEAKILLIEKASPSQIYEKILHESRYLEYLKAQKDYESLSRIENLNELFNAIRQYETSVSDPDLAGFLETINLDAEHNDKTTESAIKNTGEVLLMTVHGAKGLEFNHVFLVGAEEAIFPSYRTIEEGEMGIEEERRLFYVAMTRAMKKLTILFAQGRMLYGQVKFNGPSRFIHEIPQDFFMWKRLENEVKDDFVEFNDNFDQTYRGPDEDVIIQVNSRKNETKFVIGSRVIHSLYGVGKVLETSGSGADEKVLVKFVDGAKKRFMVKIAPLEVI